MEAFCGFCRLTEEEGALIEIATNSLLIDGNCYEFSSIFQQLFNITPDDLQTLNFICETCKDSAVNFFVFKTSIYTNPHRKMIFTQVDDFLKQTKHIEQVQIVRKLNSIMLQVDEVEAEKPPEVIEDFEEFSSEEESVKNEVVIVSDFFLHCLRCGEELASDERSELHDFFRHSLIGIQIENDAYSNKNLGEKIIRSCSNCALEFEDSTALTYHAVEMHSDEIIEQVNQIFGIKSGVLDMVTIKRYVEHIKNLIRSSGEVEKLDEEVKKYFYEIYSGGNLANDEEDLIEEDEEVKEVFEEKVKSKRDFSNLTNASREWVRNEMSLRKKIIQDESGESRTIYRCAYCSVYTSNTSPGFRYHLITKHLKESNLKEVQHETDEFSQLRVKGGKNTCFECFLKFKDNKLLTAHLNCHELFKIIANYYIFHSCNSCNILFIDSDSLELHLMNHDKAKLPVQVPVGAVFLQGKQIPGKPPDDEEDSPFSWSCGHCVKKFAKENSCRFHLLMHHVVMFTCPIDKREFCGYKAVSLFSHHLRNKHPQFFPDLLFSCTFCNQQFPTIYDKLSHMKSCSEKKFECDHCEKKFFKKGDLLGHLRFVNGELVFPCASCDKKCETLSDLRIHERSHTKEKPFDCPICRKKFRTLATRSAHVESHNLNEVFTCHCGKSFRQRQIYRRHMKAVHESGKEKKSQQIR